ncbi:MAG: hypothetical protein EXR98_08395 [Gemmataceae bacterium]|nr:hypothetical protein [Gemmataceae bacterium]
MLTRLVFLSALILVSTVFLTGAWPSSIAPLARQTETTFVPKAVPLDADIVGAGLDAQQLLQKVLTVLEPENTPWLRTKVRQTVTAADSSFFAEGFLQRGPNHCARLEMNIVAKNGISQLRVVSDGDVIAEARLYAGQNPTVSVKRLLADNRTDKNELLAKMGCGGPYALVQEFKNQLTNAAMQTGLLEGNPVIRIQGDLKPPQGARAAFAGRSCCIDLDAETLWPHRLEWQESGRSKNTLTVVRIDFLEPELHRELSAAECMKVFSYRPN